MVVKPRLLERLFPGLALRQFRNRILLEQVKRVYDAAQGSSQRVRPTDQRSPDAVMEQAGDKLRRWGRHLDENHDLTIGVLDVLVNNIVGTGITVEPMVKTKGGKTAVKVNQAIRKLLKDWARRPEVTGELPDGEAQRLICRTWLRDGEALVQHVRGPRFRHPSKVPYSMELIEPDLLPFAQITGNDRVVHGVEKDTWGRPAAYHLFKAHPGNLLAGLTTLRSAALKRVPAEDMIHLKFTRRFRQTRGVSILHGVIGRLADIKDYDESERIAARIAASLTAFIKRSADFAGEMPALSGDRSFEMQSGMIFDNLLAGEDVGMIKSDRPNDQMGEFIKTQLRGLAAGTSTNYSSVAKDYGGTYSSQRQELVESQPAYARLRNYFIEVFMHRRHVEIVSAAVASGVLALGRGVDPETLFDADMRTPGIPWIDMFKEAQAEALQVEKRFKSRTQVIRDHGGDPDVVEEQIKQERERDRENGFAEPEPGAGQPGSAGGNGGAEADGDGPPGDGSDSGEDAAAA